MFIWFALCVGGALARSGYVQTQDGKIHEGHVRFESNAVVVVNAEKELWVEVPLTNLLTLTLEAERAPQSPVAADAFSGVLPTPWQSEDIGSVRRAGGAEFRSGIFRLKSSGTNILAESDSFHFVFKRIQGDSEIVGRVISVQVTDPWARAGLMMRENLASDAANVLLSLTAWRGGVFQWRAHKGDETSVSLDRGMAVPFWIKLKREGDLFTALKSSNGRRWAIVDKVKLRMMEEIYVGLAAAGLREEVLGESAFEGVEEAPALRNHWFLPQVELQSGTVQTGYIVLMDDTAIHFDQMHGKESVSVHGVTNIRFQSVPSRLSPLLASGRTGVLLNSGEFIDGECRRIEKGRLVLSSVPLGLCRYDVNNEVIAVVFRKRMAPGRHSYVVKQIDGSVWCGLDLAMDQQGLLIREPMLGNRRVYLHEVLELRRSL